jgi:AbrB family looped-hinge helix DNA binding protein
MNPTSRTGEVQFTTKGQVVIPSWLREEYNIEKGTKAIVTATPEGILLKPMTAALIKRGRGILKRKARSNNGFAEEWAGHKKRERDLEERHAR